jgi:Hg(II)-responsive transcriptional regulator
MWAEGVIMKLLTIGQVARRARVGIETVRFYEREGLLNEPARRASGYRQYTEDVVARLRFIKRAKALGFTLKEIGELLALRLDPETSCAEIKDRAKAKIDDIQAKIRDLQQMGEALVTLTASCKGDGPTSAAGPCALAALGDLVITLLVYGVGALAAGQSR